ncbi:MAG: hypothetical protein AAFN77_08910 [Planctomycetota bacterium]
MKRSVAILGTTPAFVRWAIWHPCALRPLFKDRFIDQTFRTLRSLKELSVARADSRCHEGFCVHPQSSQQDAESLEGFSIEEVTATFGGLDHVQSACQPCDANISRQSQDALVGCYGFLTTNGFSFDRLLSGYPQSEFSAFDLVAEVQRTAKETDLLDELRQAFDSLADVQRDTLIWYQLWKPDRISPTAEKMLNQNQLVVLEKLFHRLLQRLEERVGNEDNIAPEPWRTFATVLAHCVQKNLKLVAELVPSGHSDGTNWQLNRSCPECRCEETIDGLQAKHQTCRGCGRIGSWTNGAKFKVLGKRPYIRLSDVIGIEGSKTLSEKIANRTELLD